MCVRLPANNFIRERIFFFNASDSTIQILDPYYNFHKSIGMFYLLIISTLQISELAPNS